MGILSRLFGSRQPPTPPVNAKRILVADSSITIRKVIELTLASHRLSPASTASEALDALARDRFDLVISGVIFPDGTGYHICREAKAKGIPVMLMRGRFEEFDQAQAQSAGADATMTKPFESKALAKMVDRLLAQKH